MFDRGDVIAGFEQTGLRSSIEPGHAAAKQLHMQLVLFEIEQIQIGDLELAARRWTQRLAKIDNLRVVNVKTRHRKVASRFLRLFFETDCFAALVEFYDSVA